MGMKGKLKIKGKRKGKGGVGSNWGD